MARKRQEAALVCCRKKPREAGATLWVLPEACWNELGRACLGKAGGMQGNTPVPQGGGREVGAHLVIMLATA